MIICQHLESILLAFISTTAMSGGLCLKSSWLFTLHCCLVAIMTMQRPESMLTCRLVHWPESTCQAAIQQAKRYPQRLACNWKPLSDSNSISATDLRGLHLASWSPCLAWNLYSICCKRVYEFCWNVQQTQLGMCQAPNSHGCNLG
jgi:hypothetical protein